jgi:hypothetical protein
MEKYSQCGQDLILLKYLENKKDGFFLDIGCGYPITINNTYLLEKNYGWDGLSLDIEDYLEPDGRTWGETRNSIHILNDALNVDYLTLLREHKAPKVIDFITMDLEPPTLTFELLYKIPFDDYSFNFISFETDEGREGGEYRKLKSREYITSKGYFLLGNLGGQDDMYINNNILNVLTHNNFYDVLIGIGIPEHTIKQFNNI